MSDPNSLEGLQLQLLKQRSVLERICSFVTRHWDVTMAGRERTQEDAIVLAQLYANFYTCAETLFLRVSQFFENSLGSAQWHKQLLEEMTLRVEGQRERVLSDKTYQLMFEFLQFRHFTRYYFEFEYDWDRLVFVHKKHAELMPLLRKDLDAFEQFLKTLAS